MTEPLTVGDLAELTRAHLRLGEGQDADLLAEDAAAALGWLATAKGDPETWPAQWRLGVTRLTAALYRTRNTPGGAEGYGDVAQIVQKIDPLTQQMLEIGWWARPEVG